MFHMVCRPCRPQSWPDFYQQREKASVTAAADSATWWPLVTHRPSRDSDFFICPCVTGGEFCWCHLVFPLRTSRLTQTPSNTSCPIDHNKRIVETREPAQRCDDSPGWGINTPRITVRLIFLNCHGGSARSRNWSALTVVGRWLCLAAMMYQCGGKSSSSQNNMYHSGDGRPEKKKKHIPLQDKITFSYRKSEKW